MSDKVAPDQGLMEGGGAYNRHAMLQAAAIDSALPLLEKTARNVALEEENLPVVIADYGCSEGKNSLAPMRLAIQTLREKAGVERPFIVVHVDQPANDFNSLFKVLDSDPDRYILEPNVFSCASGKSFYARVLPRSYVHLGWSSYAAQWLSKVPATIPDHFWPANITGAVRTEFERQSAQDWRAFLSLRAEELRSGGRLMIVQPALDDEGTSPIADLMDQVNVAIAEMVDEGAIEADERARMVISVLARRKRDSLAPFEQNGRFQQLVVEHCELAVNDDAAWPAYEQDRDAEAWARRHARFFRSTMATSLMRGLTQAGDAESRRAFADRLEDLLTQRLMSRPAPIRSLVQTIVLAKQ